MVRADNLTKGYGDHILFDTASFSINKGERVGLVGRNGHGKTTLFRMICGEEKWDSGNIAVPKNYRIGYVKQQLEFTKETVLEEGMKGLPPGEKDHFWKVEKILAGLGFSDTDMQRHPDEFSGGYQVRLNLAKVLVAEPDLLLLDEPTNYLDITSIRWIERFLLKWPNELMLITHDRTFMDKIVTHVLGIHRRKMRKIPGTTEKYYTQLAQDEEIYEKTRANDEKRRKEIELFITRFRAKARLANMVQSRVKTLSKMEKKEKLERIKTLEFSFRSKSFPGKQLMNINNLCFSYDSIESDSHNYLINNFNIDIRAGERICVVGKNGKGKTTLLKLLAEVLMPQKGDIAYNPNVVKGFFEQTNISSLMDHRNVLEEILSSDAEIDMQAARGICGAMMFSGDDALKKISVLSGGEKSRVMLGKLLATPVNLLILDEPTNHLDLESCDSLLAAIDNFDGTVIMVTHNEMFLHALAQRLIIFQEDNLFVFDGTYQEFLDKSGWDDEATDTRAARNKQAKSTEVQAKSEVGSNMTKKEIRQKRSEIMAEKAKTLKPIEDRIKKIEHEIDINEKALEKLNADLIKASEEKKGSQIKELSQSIHTSQDLIDNHFIELERLYVNLEKKGKKFDEEMNRFKA